MKEITLTLFVLFALTANLWAQDSEYAQIEKCVNYYLEGGTNNDFETLKKAFHENATMKYIRDGEYMEVNAIEFFKSRMKPGPKQNRQTRIASINVSGNAANARLEIEYPTFSFIDYMNLIKINGEWKIVSKIFHRQAKENN